MKNIFMLFLASVLLLSGCSNETEKKEKIYENKILGFRIKIPQEWTIIEVLDYKGEIIFRSPPQGSSDEFGENLGVTVNDITGNQMDLNQLTELSIGQLEGLNDFKIIQQRNTTLAGIPAYEIVATATIQSNGIENEFKFLSIWAIKDKKKYSITYMAEIQNYENFIYDVDEMIKSFEIM